MPFFKRKKGSSSTLGIISKPSMEEFLTQKGDELGLARYHLYIAIMNYKQLRQGHHLAHAHILYQRFLQAKHCDPQVPQSYIDAIGNILFLDDDGADSKGLVDPFFFDSLMDWLRPMIYPILNEYKASIADCNDKDKRKSILKKSSHDKISHPIRTWDVETVIYWLASIGLSQYRSLFALQEISGWVLLETSAEELHNIGVNIKDSEIIKYQSELERLPPHPLIEWGEDDVFKWLTNLGLERVAMFFREQSVTGAILTDLNYDDLTQELGLTAGEVRVFVDGLNKVISMQPHVSSMIGEITPFF